MNWRVGSGVIRIGAEVNRDLRSLKALSAAALQVNLTAEEVKEVSGAAREL